MQEWEKEWREAIRLLNTCHTCPPVYNCFYITSIRNIIIIRNILNHPEHHRSACLGRELLINQVQQDDRNSQEHVNSTHLRGAFTWTFATPSLSGTYLKGSPETWAKALTCVQALSSFLGHGEWLKSFIMHSVMGTTAELPLFILSRQSWYKPIVSPFKTCSRFASWKSDYQKTKPFLKLKMANYNIDDIGSQNNKQSFKRYWSMWVDSCMATGETLPLTKPDMITGCI